MEASATKSTLNESKGELVVASISSLVILSLFIGAEGGTPDTTKDLFSPISSLSPEQKERCYERVNSKSQEMAYKFQKLFTATRKSLREEKVPVSELVGHLACLG